MEILLFTKLLSTILQIDLLSLQLMVYQLTQNNNLMRTPIYLAEKKKAKYAYQALENLEKAIIMANAFTERKYGSLKENDKNKGLKSSLKQIDHQNSQKKRVKITDELNRIPESESEQVDDIARQSQEIETRRQKIEHIEQLKNIRDSIKSSRSSLGSFTKAANKAKSNKDEQGIILEEILEREREELQDLEDNLKISVVEKLKQEQIEKDHKLEKIRRWNVIEQK